MMGIASSPNDGHCALSYPGARYLAVDVSSAIRATALPSDGVGDAALVVVPSRAVRPDRTVGDVDAVVVPAAVLAPMDVLRGERGRRHGATASCKRMKPVLSSDS